MANYLKESEVHSIEVLLERGWSQRRIARALGMSRTTVSRYVERQKADHEPGVPTGSADQSRPGVPTGLEDSQSLCLPFHQDIEDAVELGLTAQRIHQDLVAAHGFAGGYDSVKRYVRRLRDASPVPYRRMECESGEEAQVDFGTGAPLVDATGKRRRTHLFRIILSHSRKAYSESVLRQDTETFIRVLENAFRHFGGVPKTLVVDNLKAAVLKADWVDPLLNPKLEDFCRHYGSVLLPSKPRTPWHKGKVENGVKYAQDNALKGCTFPTLPAQNGYLAQWERDVADTRIHGTTRQQVRAAFELERPRLLPLPAMLFPVFEEGERKVHRDGHVEVAKSYYSVPPEYVGRVVWVRWDLRTVRVYNYRTRQQVKVHARVEPGRFQTDMHDIPPSKISGIEKDNAYWLEQIEYGIGDEALRWCNAMLKDRGIIGKRLLLGLMGLSRKHPADVLDAACREARKRHLWRLRDLRELLKQDIIDQPDLELQQEHDIIRSLDTYQQLIGDFTS